MRLSTRKLFLPLTLLVILLALVAPAVMAQDVEPEDPPVPLSLSTDYPGQVIALGESVTLNFTLRTTTEPQIVTLETADLPDGWTATFRGGGKIIESAYVEPGHEASVSLKLDPPADVSAGSFSFTVAARSDANQKAQMPISLTVKDKLPPSLSLSTDLPTLKGTTTSNFRYDVTLKNEGDESVQVNLIAEVQENFLATIKTAGQEVTNLPLDAQQSKTLSVEVKAIQNVAAGLYPVVLRAQSSDTSTALDLSAEITGQPELQITTSDGRLSGQAYAGRETPIKVIVRNNGSAVARAVVMSSTEPTGWALAFEPAEIAEIPVGEQVEVTVKARPAEKAIAGDYMLTLRAAPVEGTTGSAEFRVTVLTSTLWGVVGIILIAIAVGVVALAVMRFGRR
jgi:uncharacterized membrane protein